MEEIGHLPTCKKSATLKEIFDAGTREGVESVAKLFQFTQVTLWRVREKEGYTMTLTTEFNKLIGRCRCGDHAKNYTPRSHNQSRTYYFLPEEYVPPDFLCGACIQNTDKLVRGGLIVSEEAKQRGVVVFQAFAAYRLTPQQINSLRKIWPKQQGGER